jgi:hypothetical protein
MLPETQFEYWKIRAGTLESEAEYGPFSSLADPGWQSEIYCRPSSTDLVRSDNILHVHHEKGAHRE